MNSVWHTDVIIIGAGLAGLTTAWHLRDRSVTIIRPPAGGAASYLARGGIAAAIGEDDGPEQHRADTISAGGGLVDREIASILTRDGVDRMVDLFELSIDFDRDKDGRLDLGREAMHTRDRIVHAAGDQTGYQVTTAVRRQLDSRDDVSFADGRALELITDGDRVCGVVFAAPDNRPRIILAPTTVLATGGAGGLFEYTTNPATSCGEGIAMAARAGAALADLEFVQFHPTALKCKTRPLPLLSEAIRGEGATLIDAVGRAVMADHPSGDLAGRDQVSRAIRRRINNGVSVYLDARSISDFARRFPAADAACRAEGFNPATEPLPVTPAAHYHMGGVATDSRGATTIDGLWAVGEVACTGAHGANRLASNSLLEALVFGARAAESIVDRPQPLHPIPLDRVLRLRDAWLQGLRSAPGNVVPSKKVRDLMWRNVGIERSGSGLANAVAELEAIKAGLDRYDSARTAVECALAIADAALQRQESVGAHFRVDAPSSREPSAIENIRELRKYS